MDIEFDPIKSALNEVRRGLPFARVADLDWTGALVRRDTRRQYPEARYIAVGRIEGRVHVVAFCLTLDALRVISFRRANPREVRHYEKA